MVSTSTLLCAAIALATSVSQVNAHGYMYIPLAEFTDSVTSAWVVQIDPQWTGDWDSCSSSDDDCLTTLYSSLKTSNGYSDIRTLLDSDTDLYGADCGFTDPDATAKDPPTDGTATFSRGMVHVGPCEIWLDDTLVLTNDDCMTAYGDGTQATASIFTPVDYSSCSTSGCMLRFYWLAFQGVDSAIVWQVYKDCVPLTGPASGDGSSTSTTTTTTTSASTSGDETETTTTSSSADEAETTSTAGSSADETETTTTDAPESTTETPTVTEATETETDAPATTTEAPTSTEATETETDASSSATPSPSEKCTAARKRKM
ncbi:hypothetical protein BBJ28_00007074 [Nothophytophthora sp. Chile5]|nr:hypothetical protein BBJ28_00007074 [Nothophytophthora sp. Chile5]